MNTNRFCGAIVMAIGLAPLVWAGYDACTSPIEDVMAHLWFTGGCGLGVTLFGLMVLIRRHVMTFDHTGLTYDDRRLLGRVVTKYRTRELSKFVLGRQVREGHISPFGVSPRAVHYFVQVVFRGVEQPYGVFSSMREGPVHEIAHSAAKVTARPLLDELGDEPIVMEPAVGPRCRDLTIEDDVSLAHPPPGIGQDISPGIDALLLGNRIPRRRRAAAVLEWLLFGAISASLSILWIGSGSDFAMSILMALAVTISGIPFARVTAAFLARERLEYIDDPGSARLLVERRILNVSTFREELPIESVLRCRLQTKDPSYYGLSVITASRPVRVGANLRRGDLIWLRAWIMDRLARRPSDSAPTRAAFATVCDTVARR